MNLADQKVIRGYLLNGLSEEDRQLVEDKMICDKEYFEQILLAESEMIDDYVEGRLSEEDRRSFEESFFSSAEGREEVRFMKDLKEVASKRASSRRPPL